MPTTRVKICGITRPEDAALAAEYGADAIGLNFVAGPRLLSGNDAVRILQTIPPMVTPVALIFLDQPYMSSWHDAIETASKQLHFEFWHRVRQIYGLTEDLLTRFRKGESTELADHPDTWLPMKVESRESIRNIKIRLQQLRIRPGALVLDTASTSALGGTGQSFNWNWIAEAREAGELENLPPLILAGGLTPDNVAQAIRIAKPYAVDVSSGVEIPGKPGIKDPLKIRDFIQAAKSI
jgi:phosphoribosylanthranilate isomerase